MPAGGDAPAELVEHLVGNVFEYRRIGYDRRPMTFFAAGTVGWGAARCELFWRLTGHAGGWCLNLLARGGELTCRLRQISKERWVGRWEQFERMPVELQLVSPKPAVGPSNPIREPLGLTTVMLSCPERARLRTETLRNLAATDWGNRPVLVQIDADTSANRIERIAENGFRALQRGVAAGAEFILLLEDDLEFNQHLWHNLNCWPPLMERQVTLAGLYDPGISRIDPQGPSWWSAKPDSVYGSQAFLLSSSTARYLIRQWHSMRLPLDLRMARLAAQLGKPLFYYNPSLVHHTGVASLSNGSFHQAVDFHPFWRI